MARNTTDRDLRTRWSPSGIGPQWIACDLGSKCEVSSLSLVWYGARGLSAALAVEVSADGAAYDRVDETTLAGRGTRTTMRTFLPASARYVRVTVTPVDGSPCPSVYEIGVHGAALAMGK